jgi:hypothetical protein
MACSASSGVIPCGADAVAIGMISVERRCFRSNGYGYQQRACKRDVARRPLSQACFPDEQHGRAAGPFDASGIGHVLLPCCWK